MADVMVREMGLRDGLQNVEAFFPTESKKAWIDAECAAGVPEIQVCSFVPPKLIPQFADAAEVVAHALRQTGPTIISALVPNFKGAERALQSGVRKVDYVLSVSETHNLENVRRSTEESMEDFRRIAELLRAHPEWKDVALSGNLSTTFGCTLEGPVSLDAVLRLAGQYAELGADEIVLSDTVGYAHPGQIKEVFTAVADHVGAVPLVAHFHDTRGLGLANVHAALDVGVRRFDACLAGLGGCPFAPGATGNIVLEDLVYMLEAMGLRTGIDLDKLLEIRTIVAAGLPDEPLQGNLAKAGLPKGFTASPQE